MTEPPREPITLAYDSSEKVMSPRALPTFFLGILSVPCVAIFFIGAVVGIVAVFMGNSVLRDIRRDCSLRGRPYAIAGIILGYLSILLSLVGVLWLTGAFHLKW